MSASRRLSPLLPAAAVLALTLSASGGCKSKRQAFEGIELSTLSGAQTVGLAHCPTPKCLTVIVAPWCGYCRSSTGLIKDLDRYLLGKGVTTRVVVGQDALSPVKEYAAMFGPQTLLDPTGQVYVQGVPQFIASDASGRLLKSTGGVPNGLQAPYDDDVLAQLARMYGI